MKKIILSIAIVMMGAGLASSTAEARDMRGGAPSHRPRVEMRGPGHGHQVSKPQPPVGGRPGRMHYGSRVHNRPHGVAINYGGVSFIYSDGMFYNMIDRGYEVVRPSIGMIVPSLPTRHSVIMRDGRRHYTHDGVIYSPMRQGGTVVFRVVGFM